jgi:hypothetical protein
VEFCITLLIHRFDPAWGFVSPAPVQTAWGSAIRIEDAGKHFWGETLYVRETPVIAYLPKYLPTELQLLDWRCFNVGGHPADVESRTVPPAGRLPAKNDRDMKHLNDLLQTILSHQDRWAVYCERDCDTIRITERLTVDGACEHVIRALSGTEPYSLGFCGIAR